MTKAKLMLWWMMVTFAATSAFASEHYAISASAVASTISGTGVSVNSDQITFPTTVVATTPAPMLMVRSVERLNDVRLLARLECINSDECLPFFVDVRVQQRNDAQIATLAGSGSRPLTPTQPNRGALAVRSGSQVILLLDDDHVHVRIQAICLQGGAPGQMIRVTDRDHRLVYLAQVIDSAVVKGKIK
jgi:hypothetical protein